VREVVDRFSDEGRAGSFALDLDGEVIGEWDRFRIDQVVTNLVSNAVKYGQGKGVEIEVVRDGGTARLSVRDHGIGIDPVQQARIFGRFERAVSRENYGGFGLGLWIVRQIVEAHGGAIRLASAPGEGASFTVELPIGEPV
jgi:signal transduction histidine kinase